MERRAIAVRGSVQGVGFRPYVYGLASRFSLHGFVRNDPDGVLIEVEGDDDELDRFEQALRTGPPPHACIEAIQARPLPVRGDCGFRIETSETGRAADIRVLPDLATCAACLTELFDPADRRYRYPFITCTNCGPRLTIVTAAPYDRDRTTMARFSMCERCRAEYDDPWDRRFHAQPIACPACGPRLTARTSDGAAMNGDPLRVAADAIGAGSIVAVKGLGGYHLACDATNGAAVASLRQRKQRDEKPFAVMVRDLDVARALCRLSPAEQARLTSPARPIVLVARRGRTTIDEGVAPANPRLGVMLAYTPLHHLLLADCGVPLVMTSGNRSDEPIAQDDDDALARLGGIADVFLTHDRSIHVRADDSVTQVVGGAEVVVRRSRGHAPAALTLPVSCAQPLLAVGGQLKNTFMLARGRHGILSHHIGDLDEYRAYQAFVRDVGLYGTLFRIDPEVVACDLHPDYASTRYADSCGIPRRIAVQHHHAHVAACMAEHGLTGDVIGVAFDGTGYGADGAIWGGEFLVGGYAGVERAAHLRYVPLPGGERAVREPWRMAVSHLIDAGEGWERLSFRERVPPFTLRSVAAVARGGTHAPPTSSVGRLFDAVAAIVLGRATTTYEGQAATALEWAASDAAAESRYAVVLDATRDPATIDTRSLVAEVVRDVRDGVAASHLARRFHSWMSDMIVEVCVRQRRSRAIDRVVLSGGVFLNTILVEETPAALRRAGFEVFTHRLVPPTDGGLALGQTAVAAARLDSESE